MASWWHRDVIAAGKLPLMLCFLAFVVTFAVTRTITRMIRDGRGPFRNQVTASGTHIHHSVPGIILLIIGAFTAVGGPDSLGWRSFAAVAVGIGTSLVLDEFAMILHLQDVYWSGEGQLSVEAVSLTAACLGLALAGFSPFGITDIGNIELTLRLTATGILVIDGVLSFICVLKGKYRTALFGLFLPLVGVAGAVRLARPSSIWARHRYRGERLERATRRAADFDRRWAPLQSDWEGFIGGKPSQPNPPVPLVPLVPPIPPVPRPADDGHRLVLLGAGLGEGAARPQVGAGAVVVEDAQDLRRFLSRAECMWLHRGELGRLAGPDEDGPLAQPQHDGAGQHGEPVPARVDAQPGGHLPGHPQLRDRHAPRLTGPRQQPGRHPPCLVPERPDHHVGVVVGLHQLVKRGAEGPRDRGELIQGNPPVTGLDPAQRGRAQVTPGRQLVQRPAQRRAQTPDALPDKCLQIGVLLHTQECMP